MLKREDHTLNVVLCAVIVWFGILGPVSVSALGLDKSMIPTLTLQKTTTFSSYSEKTYVWNYGTINVYTNTNGATFAITWSGSRAPSPASLGITDTRTPGMFHNPHEENRTDNDFRIMRGGVMGHLWGKVWIPSLVPSGIAHPEDLP
jgi:hypothetical protein